MNDTRPTTPRERPVADLLREADAAYRPTPPPAVWERVSAGLREAAPPPATRPRPRRLRPRRERVSWWAVAAGALAVAVAGYWSLGAPGEGPAAAPSARVAADLYAPAAAAETLELPAAPAAVRTAGLYEGVEIREGEVGVHELRVCSPC